MLVQVFKKLPQGTGIQSILQVLCNEKAGCVGRELFHYFEKTSRTFSETAEARPPSL